MMGLICPALSGACTNGPVVPGAVDELDAEAIVLENKLGLRKTPNSTRIASSSRNRMRSVHIRRCFGRRPCADGMIGGCFEDARAGNAGTCVALISCWCCFASMVREGVDQPGPFCSDRVVC